MSMTDTIKALGLTDSKYAELATVIEPYLPALQRVGRPAIDRFMELLLARNWQRIDAELYEHMTEDERDALGKAVLRETREALRTRYSTLRTWRQDILHLLLAVVVGR